MITSVEAMIQQYVASWNETTYDDYAREFAKCWAPEATYTDPNFEGIKGVEGIADFAKKSLDIVPERVFSIHEAPEFHHNTGKYLWAVEFAGQKRIGTDYFEYNDVFKITRLVSFLTLPDDYPLEKLA